MDIHDYLIDQDEKDWNQFMSDWGFLLPESFTIWIVNRFGDIFLVLDDGSVHFFDVGSGTLSRVADSRDDFCRLIDLDDNANQWLMIDLTNACLAAGLTLAPDQCYGYKVPPLLGGEYLVDNVVPTDLAVHYSFMADICRQARDLPDGTKVEVVVVNPPPNH